MSTPRRSHTSTAVKRAVQGIVAVAIIAVLVVAFRPKPAVVQTAHARRAALRVMVDVEGMTRVRDRYVVAAPVAGRLLRPAVRAGDMVRAGDVVATLAPLPLDAPTARQARARVEGARASEREAATTVRLAESSAAQARRDLQRIARLHEAGALASRELEEADVRARSADDDVTAARAHAAAATAEVEQATAVLMQGERTSGVIVTVRAPSAGRVLRVAEASERVLAPGTAIAELGDTGALEVVLDVLSGDAARVRPGMRVELDGWGSESAVIGRVRLVEPGAHTRLSALGVEEQRVDVIVDVAAQPTSVGDGYRVDARIEVWFSPSTLTIPASALVRNGERWGVFLRASGRAALRAIDVGRMGDGAAQVLGGLSAGDEVIVFPSDEVQDGVRVVAKDNLKR
jgi:HlyD family secretion protein